MYKVGLSKQPSTSKLSLNNSATKLAEKMETHMPSNVQAMMLQNYSDDEIDFTLDLSKPTDTSQESSKDYSDIISEAMAEFNQKINIRHQIAKAREGIAINLGNKSYPLPPYCTLNLKCAPNFHDDVYNNDFTAMWKKKVESVSTDLLNTTVNYLDGKISELNKEMKDIIDKARSSIGYASKGSSEARKTLNSRIMEKKEKFEKELLHFKTDIKAKTLARRGNYNDRNNRRRDRPTPY